MNNKKYGLGRGLSSLIPQKNKTNSSGLNSGQKENNIKAKENNFQDIQQNNSPDGANLQMKVIEISVGDILVNEQQPRLYFNEEKLEELSQSIKEHGIIQPITVIQKGRQYELIAGERRLRAAKKANLIKVPAIIRTGTLSSQKKLELALIENIQRHDLNLIEEARAYAKLAEDFNLSQSEIAQQSGKSRSVVANRMRLTKLPIEIQKGIIDGKITEGHAKVILSIDNADKQQGLYNLILTQKMTVREAERQTSQDSTKKVLVKSHLRTDKTPQIKSLENQLSDYFKTKVNIQSKNKGGKIIIDYYSREELNNILAKLKIY
jgi:ParB family chromosome partitioning protein